VFGRLEEIRAARFSRVEGTPYALAMPTRLRPTTPIAADALLVGDPGRALLLAQELLEQPKMSNHARGLWGYSGRTSEGTELTIQATGMGGPSAAMVLADLATLGVRRAVRIGTCAGFGPDARPGELLLIDGAVAAGGSAASFGLAAGETVRPDPALLERLRGELESDARVARTASFDALPVSAGSAPADGAAADMQTVAVFARGRELGVATAAMLIVTEAPSGETTAKEQLEAAAKFAGHAASAVLSG
jgi:uridine phosphorylase